MRPRPSKYIERGYREAPWQPSRRMLWFFLSRDEAGPGGNNFGTLPFAPSRDRYSERGYCVYHVFVLVLRSSPSPESSPLAYRLSIVVRHLICDTASRPCAPRPVLGISACTIMVARLASFRCVVVECILVISTGLGLAAQACYPN
ncbi:hypothetical protein BV25DRAFT_780297 [Artomyces pyxidatus]|uniref:Uncharacterized protein n=1 Tax=Artomyces pyxidatus TaxID=48021 RepID=A0ACB8SZR8_9AGAM|nr:hypothetical protein BV25DRAFT_780297 [Artomyces pyxidatus]